MDGVGALHERGQVSRQASLKALPEDPGIHRCSDKLRLMGAGRACGCRGKMHEALPPIIDKRPMTCRGSGFMGELSPARISLTITGPSPASTAAFGSIPVRHRQGPVFFRHRLSKEISGSRKRARGVVQARPKTGRWCAGDQHPPMSRYARFSDAMNSASSLGADREPTSSSRAPVLAAHSSRAFSFVFFSTATQAREKRPPRSVGGDSNTHLARSGAT